MDLGPLALVVPLLAAAALAAVASHVRRAVADVVTVLAAAASTVLCALLLADAGSGTVVEWFGGWEPRDGVAIGISFAVDEIGAALAVFVAMLATAAAIFSSRYLEADEPYLHVLLLVFLAGMLGFCLAGDVFTMFVFFELMSVAAFALAGYKIDQSEAIEGSLNFAITNTIGSFLLLSGIALIYGRTGALNLAQIGEALATQPADGLVVVAFALIASGFLVKAAIVPFHFWLADAYAVALTPACLLFAGAMSELGLYGVGRTYFAAFSAAFESHQAELRAVLIGVGVLTAVVGAVMCVQQDHLKRMLAFATVAYMGVFLIGMGTLSAEGVAGTAVYVLGDGCAKAGLFACVGIIQHRCRGISELRLRGRGRGLAGTAALFALGGLLLASLPPFGTFLGKSMLGAALRAEGYGWAIAVIVLASVLTGATVLRAAGRVFGGWGERPEHPPATEEEGAEREVERGAAVRTPAVMWVPAVLLIAGGVAAGVWPGLADAALGAGEAFTDRAGYAAAVLEGAAVAPPPAHASSPPWFDYLIGVGSAACALGVAALALFAPRPRWRPATELGSVVSRFGAGLRALHSGRIGDYVAWLLAGFTALGGLFGLALT